MPRHTVILGSYNRPRMVREAILSVLGQSVQDFQLLVADDGSNEETLSSIRGVIGQDPRCHLLSAPHQDDSLARPDCANRAVQRINEAIPKVEGQIVQYLADDDWYDEGRFRAFDELFQNPETMVGYGRLAYVDPSGKPIPGRTRYFDHVENPLRVLDHNQVAHRKEVFLRIPKWADAIDYASEGHFFRAMSLIWKFHGTDRVVAYKREHELAMNFTKEGSTGKRE